jgi:hypothetical protein
MFKSIVKGFFSYMERIRALKIQKMLNDIEKEQEPIKKTEKYIILKIKGIGMGGMAGSTAFLEFKDNYYEKIVDDTEKQLINSALLNILESGDYNMKTKALVSYVCADIKLNESINIVRTLMQKAKKNSTEERILSRSLDALLKHESISDITYDQLRDRGEL